MWIETAYHWAPAGRNLDILKYGLQVYSSAVVGEARAPYLCFSLCPKQAWHLSGASRPWNTEEDEFWDLYQVFTRSCDNLQLLTHGGNQITEVRCFNSITPDRIWHVGRRNHSQVYLDAKGKPV